MRDNYNKGDGRLAGISSFDAGRSTVLFVFPVALEKQQPVSAVVGMRSGRGWGERDLLDLGTKDIAGSQP